MQDWRDAIDETADNLFAELVSLRRFLHAHPDISGNEFKTAKHLHQWLVTRGVAAQLVLDGRGMLVDYGALTARGRFGLRADMDALQIQDTKNVDYCSTVPNVMHACGHDVHSTILAGALLTIKATVDRGLTPQPCAIRGIFQPAEEVCLGAAEMIGIQALDEVATMMAFHVDPHREVGTVGYRAGVMAASCDELLITVSGEGGHAARPHHTRDPITATALFLNAVHVQVPRRIDSLDTIVIGFGSIKGGEQCNVIPESVHLRGTLRTLTAATRAHALKQLHEIAAGVGLASETAIELKVGANTPSVVNDPQLIMLAERVIASSLGESAADEMTRPSMGGEDFSYYLEHVPGVLLRIGSNSKGATPTGLHTHNFDVNEEVIRVGTKLMARIAIEWFDQ